MPLELNNLGFRYPGGPWIFRNVNLAFENGCRTALLGESGLGKSTLGKVLAGHEMPVEGRVIFKATPRFGTGYYPIQMILQHPESAINPRFKMREVLYEGWTPPAALLERFGIESAWLDRYPGELSGGEMQRFCIVRALGPETRFIIADEITAMFDLITQAQIWEALLAEIKARALGLIAITHDRDLGNRICKTHINLEELGR